MSTTAWLALSRHTSPDGTTVVCMEGELDVATADEAHDYLQETIRQPGGTVVVDAAGLSFCGASGLRVFTEAADGARAEGRPFMMAALRPSLLRMIRITGLDHAYPELVPVPAQFQCHH